MSKAPPGSYPKQAAAYPTQQPAYPAQPQPMQYGGGYAPPPQQAGQLFSYGAGQFGAPPPPYSERPNNPPSSAYGMQPQQVPIQQYPGMAPVGQYPTQQPYPVGQYPGQVVPPNVVHGSFDSGARFNSGATVNIPPPPPGYAPNFAQLGASQGQSVNVQQRRAGWFSGGSGGGYTFW
ncbi:DAZ-associated protein 2-like [Montipora capricornis]|uniref:DAZ-associated protein 2-like n=1 Tax=Montipora foliosa TaxID=591990 RepID=UPI0035F1FF6D